MPSVAPLIEKAFVKSISEDSSGIIAKEELPKNSSMEDTAARTIKSINIVIFPLMK